MSSTSTLQPAETVTVTTPGMTAADFDLMIDGVQRLVQRFGETAPVTVTDLTELLHLLREPCQSQIAPRTTYTKCDSGAHWWTD